MALVLAFDTPEKHNPDEYAAVLIPAAPGEFPDNRSHTVCYIKLQFIRGPYSRVRATFMFPTHIIIFRRSVWERVRKTDYPQAVDFQPIF